MKKTTVHKLIENEKSLSMTTLRIHNKRKELAVKARLFLATLGKSISIILSGTGNSFNENHLYSRVYKKIVER